MAAATVNIPAIVLSGGPMLNGWWNGKRAGSGTARLAGPQGLEAAGTIDLRRVSSTIVAIVGALHRPLQHHGHRLDHERAGRGARHVAALGCAAIPAPYRERAQIAYATGRRIGRHRLKRT
jgi:dihydroxy-acid dehydratase